MHRLRLVAHDDKVVIDQSKDSVTADEHGVEADRDDADDDHDCGEFGRAQVAHCNEKWFGYVAIRFY